MQMLKTEDIVKGLLRGCLLKDEQCSIIDPVVRRWSKMGFPYSGVWEPAVSWYGFGGVKIYCPACSASVIVEDVWMDAPTFRNKVQAYIQEYALLHGCDLIEVETEWDTSP